MPIPRSRLLWNLAFGCRLAGLARLMGVAGAIICAGGPALASADTAAPTPATTTTTPPPEPARRRRHGFLEAHAFGLMPLGGWAAHVYETTMPGLSLQQFGLGGGGAFGAGIADLWRGWDLMLRLHLGVLSTGAWERYAAQHGSNVSASARLGNVSLVLTRAIDVSPRVRVAFGGGPGVAWGWGEETDPATTTYPYTMLGTAASVAAVARVIVRLRHPVALVGELSGLLGTPIVTYGSNDERALAAVVAGVGVRVEP
jgi:hypothetical protein